MSSVESDSQLLQLLLFNTVTACMYTFNLQRLMRSGKNVSKNILHPSVWQFYTSDMFNFFWHCSNNASWVSPSFNGDHPSERWFIKLMSFCCMYSPTGEYNCYFFFRKNDCERSKTIMDDSCNFRKFCNLLSSHHLVRTRLN